MAVATHGPAAHRLPDPRHEECEADRVGEKAGREEERTCEEDHGTVRELRSGKPASCQLPARRVQGASALPGHERGADDGGEQHDGDRRADADALADDHEQHDLCDRGHDERDEDDPRESHPSEITGVGNLCHMQFRDLPAVDELAGRLAAVPELADVPVPLIAGVAREAIDRSRRSIAAGENPDPIAHALASLIELARRRPRRVINATGVLLHTNLGRAPLHPSAVAAASDSSAGYTNLEFDLGSGNRGGRGSYVETLLQTLTGAESALVVNNNAGALFLALAALAGGAEAVVSRGELIEIGGSFRLPDLMSASGARLVEVGTTNRTRASDYAAAMATASLVLKVHPSNYRIEGFAEEVGYRELAEVCAAAGIPFVADLGSGLLDTRVPWLDGSPPRWLDGEPGVRQTIDAGAAVVLFSGDKLLGGPQAGIAVGRRELIERMRRHPIARALRLDGTTMASLAATLELYASGQGRSVPFWHMATIPAESLQSRVEAVLSASGVAGAVIDGESLPGAGSVPGATIPTPTLELRVAADASWKTLIAADPPIVARRRADTLMLDLRTVAPADDETVARVLATLAGHP